MERTDPRKLATAYALAARVRPVAGPAGQQFGRGTGSSLEFQEFRDYQVGDDLRHIDWRAYARSDKLTTRLYREEIAATLEVVIDGSASMALTSAKEQCVREVVAFLSHCASADHSVRGVFAASTPLPLDVDTLHLANPSVLRFAGGSDLLQLPIATLLRPGTVRVVISDFLFPHAAVDLVRKAGRRAGALWLIQVLDPEEADPDLRGQIRLEEVESDQWREIEVDDRCVERYRKRLGRLWSGLQTECRRVGGAALRLVAGPDLADQVRTVLLPAGVVEAR